MLLEVIVTTLDQAIQAEAMGAGRLELVMGIVEGGLTPSYAMVELIKKEVDIPLVVMIRPHSKSFSYSLCDIELMKRDIQIFNKLEVDGFVMGALDKENNIDMTIMQELLREVGDTSVVFHRAFDVSRDYRKSLNDLKNLPKVKRLLTSFGSDASLKNIEEYKYLTSTAQNQGLTLVWGGGVTRGNLKAILNKIKPDEVHIGSSVRFHLDAKEDLDLIQMNFFTETLKDF